MILPFYFKIIIKTEKVTYVTVPVTLLCYTDGVISQERKNYVNRFVFIERMLKI